MSPINETLGSRSASVGTTYRCMAVPKVGSRSTLSRMTTLITTRAYSKVLSGTQRHTVPAAQRPDLRVHLPLTKAKVGGSSPSAPTQPTTCSRLIDRGSCRPMRTHRVEYPVDRLAAERLREELTDPRGDVLPLGTRRSSCEPLPASSLADVSELRDQHREGSAGCIPAP